MSTTNLTALVASRICHDLISPVGAISNGVELMGLTGSGGEELNLISDSAQNASARVRFFRVAFGLAAHEQMIGSSEMQSIFSGLADDRFSVTWHETKDVTRGEAQLVCLATLCLEHSFPRGAEIHIHHDDVWTIGASGDVLRADDELWNPMISGYVPDDLTPKTLPFALLPMALRDLGRRLNARFEINRVLLTF